MPRSVECDMVAKCSNLNERKLSVTLAMFHAHTSPMWLLATVLDGAQIFHISITRECVLDGTFITSETP